MRLLRAPLTLLASFALLGAQDPEPETKPGVGVLCTAIFVYVADLQGDKCYPRMHPEYQERLDQYRVSFDDYLTRNLPNGAEGLQSFKDDQIASGDPEKIVCPTNRDDNIYEAVRPWVESGKADEAIEKLLARDGKPTFGDCV